MLVVVYRMHTSVHARARSPVSKRQQTERKSLHHTVFLQIFCHIGDLVDEKVEILLGDCLIRDDEAEEIWPLFVCVRLIADHRRSALHHFRFNFWRNLQVCERAKA